MKKTLAIAGILALSIIPNPSFSEEVTKLNVKQRQQN
tara:strand:- start:372 stop:482 length:111 start_codon:yes stop_codon:yes gene_type:complete